jgi:hypothetical protein
MGEAKGLALESRKTHPMRGPTDANRRPRVHEVTRVQPDLVADGARKPIVFIAGMGRSGSTLLERMLGQLPGWFSVGEMVHIWTRGLTDNERCGCGRPFRECEVWSAIGERAFGGWDQVNPSGLNEMRLAVERDRYIPFLLYPRLKPGFLEDVLAYTEVLERIYDAARQVTGSSIVVDSSKHVPAALALRLNPGMDLRIVHLVRDSRGVAYSWSKAVMRPATSGETLMARWSPLEASLRYLAYNSLLSRVFADSAVRIRYEDFVAEPDGTVASVAEWLGSDAAVGEWLGKDGSVALAPSHGLSGNPMRFKTGAVELSVDDEWTRSMRASDRLLVTAVTLPSLLRYRYRLTSAGSRDREV